MENSSSSLSPADALAVALDTIGGRWKLLIIHELLTRTLRFGELRKAIPAISQKVLAQHLRELESDGLLQRQAYSEMPPRVEYQLTAYGCSLAPVVQVLAEWGHEHHAAHAPAESANEEEMEAIGALPKAQGSASNLSPDELTRAIRAGVAFG